MKCWLQEQNHPVFATKVGYNRAQTEADWTTGNFQYTPNQYAPWCPHFEDNCEENDKTTEVKLWKDTAK